MKKIIFILLLLPFAGMGQGFADTTELKTYITDSIPPGNNFTHDINWQIRKSLFGVINFAGGGSGGGSGTVTSVGTNNGTGITGGTITTTGTLAVDTAHVIVTKAYLDKKLDSLPAGSSGITIDATPITGGTTGGLLFQNAAGQVSMDASSIGWAASTKSFGIAVGSNTTSAMTISRNTSSTYPFLTLDDVGSAGEVLFTDGASGGFLPTLIMKPDGTTMNWTLLTSRTNDAGSEASMTFRAANFAGSGALASKPLFDFQNFSTSAFKLNADYTSEWRGKFKTYNNAAPTNGQLLIGNTSGGTFDAGTLASANGSITVTNGGGTIDLATTVTLASGKYTPTLTNITNLDGSTAYDLKYTRVGNIVDVRGNIGADPTTGSTTFTIEISLPIASAFTATTDGEGLAIESSTTTPGAGTAAAEITNDRIQFIIYAPSANASVYKIHFSYEIL